MRYYLQLESSYKQKILDYRLSRRQRVGSFGLFTKIFTVLQKVMEVTLEKVELTIRNVCALHNSIIKGTMN